MARRRRMTRLLPRTDTPSADPDRDEELDGLLVEVLDPTSPGEEEDEELDLLAIRRKLAASVGAPVSVCAKIFLSGGELLFERVSPDHPLIVGRHESSDLTIPDPSVSRRHAELTYRDDAWFIRDLDSRSGTQVNGEAVTGLVRLKEGDRLQFGHAVLNVSFGMPSDSDADREPASFAEGKTGVVRKSASSVRTNATARETPVFADEPAGRESGASTPAVAIAGSSGSSGALNRAGVARAPKSGRVDVKKRQMDIQDRREAERIKTVGLLGGLAIAAFLIYAVVSSLSLPSAPAPAPTTPPPADTARLPERKTAQAPIAAADPVDAKRPAAEPPPVQPPEPQAVPQEQGVPPAASTAETPVAPERQPEAPAPAASPRLPEVPEPLLAEVSPFEPRWFAGPGTGTALTGQGETIKGSFLIEGDTIHVDAAGVATKARLVDLKELTWDGSRDFPEADATLRNGRYALAAERYLERLRELETALREEGKDPAQYPGRWYAEGRRDECLRKAAHWAYCEAVFSHPEMATAEQLGLAGSSFTRLATPGGTPKALRDSFEALLAAGKIALSAADRNRWDDLVQPPRCAQNPAKGPDAPVEVVEVEKPAPATPKETVAANPTGSKAAVQPLDPKILTLTCVGGTGDQYIHEVGFLPDGTIYGKGTGFMVGYSKDGAKCLGISGDLNTPSREHRGANWSNKGSSILVDGLKLTIGYRQVHAILQQPFLESSAGWKWWGWPHEEAKKRELMADSRGVALYPLPGGRFLAKCWCDGGNTVLEKDPRDLDKQNPALANAYNRSAAGSASLYIVGNAKTGEPLQATWMVHRPQAEAVDAQGRVYISQQAARKHGPIHKDSLGLGGRAGLSIFSPDLSECLFSGTLGGDEIYALALRDNLLVLGGSIGMARKDKEGKSLPCEIDPAGLPLRNPAQPKPGGGEDGFLAILKLW